MHSPVHGSCRLVMEARGWRRALSSTGGGAVSRGNLKRIKKNDLILFCRCFMGSKGD